MLKLFNNFEVLIGVITIYQSFKINTILSIVFLLEIISLSYYHRISAENILHTQYCETFVFVVLLSAGYNRVI
ncbi:hypothetical protein ACQKII_01470 [Lysinibacillus sp. NPDC048646]|uniref:hypothetical protein n=1 Tax=Lysinibacillus sp. NPDC048646 TaxID=3390574 RepID=UPI003D0799D7